MILQEAINNFLESKVAHTRRTYATAIRHFLTFLAIANVYPTHPADVVTLDHAYRFSNWLSNAYRTQRERVLDKRSRAVYLIAVGRFFHHLITVEHCVVVDYVDYENFKDFLKEQTKYGKRLIDQRLPKDDMVAGLIDAISAAPDIADLSEKQARRRLLIWRRDRAIILALHSSGMRVSELCGLRRGNLDYAEHTAIVLGKGDRQRTIYLSDVAWRTTMEYLKDRQDGALGMALETIPLFCRHDRSASDKRLALSTHAVRDLFTRLARETGIAERFNMTPHTLRHYFATRFL